MVMVGKGGYHAVLQGGKEDPVYQIPAGPGKTSIK